MASFNNVNIYICICTCVCWGELKDKFYPRKTSICPVFDSNGCNANINVFTYVCIHVSGGAWCE